MRKCEYSGRAGGLTRESKKSQPPELRFRAMHATDGRWDVRFERAATS
jgi:hypothetical protein